MGTLLLLLACPPVVKRFPNALLCSRALVCRKKQEYYRALNTRFKLARLMLGIKRKFNTYGVYFLRRRERKIVCCRQDARQGMISVTSLPKIDKMGIVVVERTIDTSTMASTARASPRTGIYTVVDLIIWLISTITTCSSRGLYQSTGFRCAQLE